MDPTSMAEQKEFEELMQLLETYESKGHGLGPIPQDLQEIMANVKRARGQQAAEQQAAQDITPQPGYVIKTVDAQQRKVFINVCSSPQVPAPSCWAEGMAPERVMQALQDMQTDNPNADTEALRFAISVSDMQHDTDKQGQPCITVDCVLNSDVLKQAQHARPIKAFVNELTVDYVSQKHKLELDPKYKLPKMSYKGTEIRSQRIKLDPKRLVSDVTSTRDNSHEPSFPLLPTKAAAAAAKRAKAGAAGQQGSSAALTNGSAAAAAQSKGTPAAAAGGGGTSSSSSWQHDIKCEGKPVTHMVVSVQLPAAGGSSSGGSSSSSCEWQTGAVQVQLCGTQLRVAVDHNQQQQQQQQGGGSSSGTQRQQEPTALCIHLPFAAQHVGAAAQLQGSTGQLVVRLPYLPVQQWVQQLQQEAPRAFTTLPVAHESYMELDD